MPENQPDGYHTITPQAINEDPDATIAFVEQVLGGTVHDKYVVDGVIVHSEVQVGDSKLMIAAPAEDFPVFPVNTHTYVEDVDAVYRAAIDHGAESIREPEDQFYGDRSATVRDGQGNVWSLATHIEDVSQEEMHRRMEEMSG